MDGSTSSRRASSELEARRRLAAAVGRALARVEASEAVYAAIVDAVERSHRQLDAAARPTAVERAHSDSTPQARARPGRAPIRTGGLVRI